MLRILGAVFNRGWFTPLVKAWVYDQEGKKIVRYFETKQGARRWMKEMIEDGEV